MAEQISTIRGRRTAECDEPCLGLTIELAAFRGAWPVHDGSLDAFQGRTFAGPLDGRQTDIQGIDDLGVDPAGTEFAGIRLQEDASTGHGAGGGSAAAYRLLPAAGVGLH
ncbi:MAG: hypothetical protein NVS2B16_27900 [Chloroflexota bacterium]